MQWSHFVSGRSAMPDVQSVHWTRTFLISMRNLMSPEMNSQIWRRHCPPSEPTYQTSDSFMTQGDERYNPDNYPYLHVFKLKWCCELLGTKACRRSRVVRHWFLRAMACHHFHPIKSCFMAMESPHASHLRRFIPCVRLHVLDSVRGCL